MIEDLYLSIVISAGWAVGVWLGWQWRGKHDASNQKKNGDGA